MRPEKTVAYYLPELRRVGGDPNNYLEPGGHIVPIHQIVLRDVADLLEDQQSKLIEAEARIKELEGRLATTAKIGDAVERIDVPKLGQLIITREICDRYAVWFAEPGEPWEIEDISNDFAMAKEYVRGFLMAIPPTGRPNT